MAVTAPERDEQIADINRVAAWLAAFEKGLTSRSRRDIETLFVEDSYWRDLVAFTWNVRQVYGREALLDLLFVTLEQIAPSEFHIADDRPAPNYPAMEPGAIELFFKFETEAGYGRGRVTLVEDPESRELQAKVLVTKLTDLRSVQPVWPRRDHFDHTHPDISWAEHIVHQRAYESRDPEVLVVGGGQGGIMTAARLSRLGIDALIIDEKPRVGDAWRSRYDALQLHNPHGSCYFPYLQFPVSYPEYIPKDKFAEWFEIYVTALDLNFWTSTRLVSADYDEVKERWDVELSLSDGKARTMHPRHLVLATGGGGGDIEPQLPGLDSFEGDKQFASQFKTAAEFSDKDVLIVGVGTTAHDIAEDVVKHGGRPTLLQRSPLIVINQSTANIAMADYNAREIPTEVIDERFEAALIWPLFYEGSKSLTQITNEIDKELLGGLRQAGMKLWNGTDDTGWFVNFFKTYGGYYFNVGASDMIVDGRIKVLQRSDLDHFEGHGLVLNDGQARKVDTVIYATGQKPPSTTLRRLLGDEIADRVGPIWGVDGNGECANIGKVTAQQGLWIMMGGIPQTRWWTAPMSLLIAAELAGVVPTNFKDPGHPSRTPAHV